MLARRTLQILMVMSRRDKALAEQAAADAARTLSDLDRNEVALQRYVGEMASGMETLVGSGYDLLSFGSFIHAGVRAIEMNRVAQVRGVRQKDAATSQIAQEVERAKGISAGLAEYQKQDAED